MNSLIDVLPSLLPFTPLIFVFLAIISLISCYPNAQAKTSKSHRYYVPPEKRVFGPFTLADLVFILFNDLWILIAVAIIAYLVRNHWSGEVDISRDTMTAISVGIFLLGPVIGWILSDIVKKREK